ncbi:MAG: tRNA (adenosine(37)-N6)-dimethylallyltransferase MiaA [Clostridia bacterium]|nr:tRNA (adenosine(37)-N6)-dimethylallyltransferase MiaA [Clostridia bacterium]
MKKLVIITGLTGSGKSNLALDIARKYNGEIISADSVQIYKGLDIGSAKVSVNYRQEIPHHLIDIKNFNETYNVGEFLVDCKNAIDTILNKDKLPIIVGGTGMYIKALLEGYSCGNKADLDFRAKYEKLALDLGNKYVWDELNTLNPDKAKTVHPNNLKRVIRYLEMEKLGIKDTNVESILKDFDICAVGIVAEREVIYDKINKRVDKMINSGLEQEVKNLIHKGATRDFQSTNSIGYKEWFDYFEGNQSLDKTIDLIKQHTRNYCKRQLTFLKIIKDLRLLEKEEAKTFIEEFLNDRKG